MKTTLDYYMQKKDGSGEVGAPAWSFSRVVNRIFGRGNSGPISREKLESMLETTFDSMDRAGHQIYIEQMACLEAKEDLEGAQELASAYDQVVEGYTLQRQEIIGLISAKRNKSDIADVKLRVCTPAYRSMSLPALYGQLDEVADKLRATQLERKQNRQELQRLENSHGQHEFQVQQANQHYENLNLNRARITNLLFFDGKYTIMNQNDVKLLDEAQGKSVQELIQKYCLS